MASSSASNYLIPGAIVVAGILIAIALFAGGGGGGGTADTGGHGGFGNSGSGAASSLAAITDADHVLGDRNASVSIVEFSDFECPFCARLHPTLTQIVNEFEGEVNWVYRHFPLTSIHSRALSAAVASECVAELAGNDAFWSFTNTLFEQQRSLGPALYEQTASSLGISTTDFAACQERDDIATKVRADLSDATNSGGRGTPHVVVVSASGQYFPFSGALPYEQLKPIITQALAN